MDSKAASRTRFRKRTYSSLKGFLSDLSFPLRHMAELRRLRDRGLVSSAFRERLMLTVSAVNGCRYCSYFHAKEALRNGVDHQEIAQLLSGSIAVCPEEESVALLYAQHWAETDAHPAQEAVQTLEQSYGVDKANAIHLVLRMIRMGNLSGNTLDYALNRISRGRLRGST